jgi:hypothetical protein
MSAFASMLAAVHADTNIGTPADFRRPPGPWVPARVVLSRPTDTIGGLGGIATRAGSLAAALLAGDIAPLVPRRGDELLLDGRVRSIETAEPDPLGLSWRLVLSDLLSEAAPDPVIGAIRYDAWDVPSSGLTQAEQAALSQTGFTHRAPFWAAVAGSSVTLPAATQARMDAEIAHAAAAGLAFWAFLGWDPSTPEITALNLYRSSSRRGDIGFCMIENMQGLYYLGTWLPNVARTIALMAEPGYRKVFGTRPLLFINSMSDADIMARFGSMDATATVLDGIREHCVLAGVGDPYIVMMDGWHTRAAALAGYGADAASSYAAIGQIAAPTPYISLMAAAEQWRIDAAALGVDVVPPLTFGWDYRPRIGGPPAWFGAAATGDPNAHWLPPTPDEIARHAADAVAWLRANEPAAPAQIAIAYAWNEFSEGGWLCPTFLAGEPAGDTARIAALATVLKR